MKLKLINIIFLLIISYNVVSHTQNDAILMKKKELCVAIPYQYSAWDHNWKRTLLRDNPNLGTVSQHMIMAKASYGIIDRLKIITSIPFVKINAAQGTFRGEKGIQNLSIGLKSKLLDKDLESKFNQSNYFTDLAFNSGEVKMPNRFNLDLTIGYFKNLSYLEISYFLMNSEGNNDIRRNVLPILSSNMENKQTVESERIANFCTDGPSSSNPPGHRNQIVSEQIPLSKLNLIRTARVFEGMNMSIQDGGIACWDAEYFNFTPRLSQIDPNSKTLIGLPNFSGYISAHSTFSGAGATVLSYFFPSETTKMNNYANEASNSRIYGCIQFRHDSKVGLEFG